MRIPLRTLLAYLDDMLEAEEAKRIGQKIAEDETAQELLGRIKQVTRRRRLTVPPADHPASGKMDPNTIAAYLENKLSAEQQAEIEEICLTSDVHLAEVAACHQLLTTIHGDPGTIPPTARQRMYSLVKGPEAIPFRKPPTREAVSAATTENKEIDETLRLGLPPFKRHNWHNNLVLVGGVAAAVLLLVVAIFQIVHLPSSPETKETILAQGNGQEKSPQPEPPKEEKKVSPPVKPETPDPMKETKKEEVKEPSKKEEPPEPPKKDRPSDIPAGPPSPQQVVLGNLLAPASGETTILLQTLPDKGDWKRLAALKNPEVYSGRPLVSLPGCRGTIQLNRGPRLTLWGNLSEQLPLPILESLVELHQHETLDLDMTLRRGRILLQHSQGDKPARVRLRFENPTLPDSLEFFDITLQAKGTEILVDRMAFFPPGEPFYKDPKHANRLGPTAIIGLVVLAGNITLKAQDVTFTMQAPPGPALLAWESRKGFNPPQTINKIPDNILTAPPGMDVRIRTEMLRARDDLGTSLSSKGVDVALAEHLQSENVFRRILAVRCLGAFDDLPSLVDTFSEEKNNDVRQTGVLTARHWIAASRENDYKLLEALTRSYKLSEGEKIIELLHGLTNTELLVDLLASSTLAIRELAFANLLMLRPDGRTINYSPVADAASREKAYNAWRELVKKAPTAPTK